MTYKDTDKRRQTTRERVRRWRALHQGVTSPEAEALQGVTMKLTGPKRVKARMGFEARPAVGQVDADGNPLPEY